MRSDDVVKMERNHTFICVQSQKFAGRVRMKRRRIERLFQVENDRWRFLQRSECFAVRSSLLRQMLVSRVESLDAITSRSGSLQTNLDILGNVGWKPIWNSFKPFSTEESLESAAKWITSCDEGHPNCSQLPQPQAARPTRLIDAGPNDGNSNPRLVLTQAISSADDSLEYIALSHCWGDSKHSIKTTSSNLSSHMRQIPMETMPHTFKDTIYVTRSLGARYLWIDSLCIIQDHKTEWEKECAIMGSIYENAYLTIAITAAKGSNESLFTNAKPSFHATAVSQFH